MLQSFKALGWGALGLVAFVGLFSVIQFPLHAAHLPNPVPYLLLIPIELGLYCLIVRLTERRPVRELAAGSAVPQSFLGFAAGIIIFSIAIAVPALIGHYRVLGHGALILLLVPLPMWIATGMAEELIFRGFIFRVIQKVGGTWPAVGISALVFGAMHAANPGATLLSSASIALQAGVLLALAYAVTQQLWLPIGIHVGWNFAEGTLYGTAVSGNTISASFLHGVLSGPAMLTGGRFGIENSIEANVVCLLAAALLTVLAVRNRRIIPFKRERRALLLSAVAAPRA